ncbi:hypothetical protein TNCV_337621 [Trichonephila clavipes]|nr:hypothetical protein TNCV_337621 [Trichonephila clavipes]
MFLPRCVSPCGTSMTGPLYIKEFTSAIKIIFGPVVDRPRWFGSLACQITRPLKHGPFFRGYMKSLNYKMPVEDLIPLISVASERIRDTTRILQNVKNSIHCLCHTCQRISDRNFEHFCCRECNLSIKCFLPH